MAKKPLENTYELPNRNSALTNDDLREALTNFEFLTAHFMQIVDKERQVVPFKLNSAQRYIFDTLWPMIDPKTRLDRRRQVVVVKGRQIGASVSIIAFINYICAFAEGIERMSIMHVFPQVDTISKLTQRKVEPIITGIHPAIQPEITKSTLGSSIVYSYDNILGVPRNNSYELISASANSIRGDTLNVAMYDEAAWYRHPEELEDMVGGAMPEYGFSLSVFFSTYGERYNDFFLNKIQMALDNPDEMDLVFVPWFLSYPERKLGQKFDELTLSEYESETIIPALMKYDIPKEEWGDKILWYRRKSLGVPHMKQEFPTTIEEVLTMGQNKTYFDKEAISWQRENVNDGLTYTLSTDAMTNEVRAIQTEGSSFRIIKQPQYGHKYILCVDPITAQNEDTDFFAMVMFDQDTMEAVATFHDKNLSTEDYADIAVCMAKLYCRADICPESNMAEGFIACVRALGYYNFYYANQINRAKKLPGIRTTATTKPAMLDRLSILLNGHKLKLRSSEIIEELETMEKKIKKRTDGSTTATIAARRGKHDDLVACCWLFAGTLQERQLNGRKGDGFAVFGY